MSHFSKTKPDRALKLANKSTPFLKWLGCVGSGLCIALCQQPSQAFSTTLPVPYSLTFSWDPSPSPDVVGYHLYYGVASGVYTQTNILGEVMNSTVSGLLSGVTYYFALRAVGTYGQESDLSDEISYRQAIPGAQMQISSVGGGQFTLTVNGTAGHSYDLEATTDFQIWSVIGTATLDASGSMDFTDPNAANFPQRFYRTRDTQP